MHGRTDGRTHARTKTIFLVNGFENHARRAGHDILTCVHDMIFVQNSAGVLEERLVQEMKRRRSKSLDSVATQFLARAVCLDALDLSLLQNLFCAC